MPKAAWMVEHCNADGLALKRPVVIDPIGMLSPSRGVGLAGTIDDLATLLRINAHRIGHPQAERTFLRVTEGDRSFARLYCNVEIDPTGIVSQTKREMPYVFADLL